MRRDRTGWLLVGLHVAAAAIGAWAARDSARWGLMVGAAVIALGTTAVVYRRGAPRTLVVLLVAVVLRLFWVGLPPSLSDDSYRYAWDGTLVLDGINPYEFRPSDPALATFRDSTVYARLNSKEYYSVYPPASQAAFAAVSRVTDGRFPAFFFVFKALVVALELAALLLLARMVSPGILMLFAWNPLVLIAGAGQGHSDVLLALPLVLAVATARSGRWGSAGAMVAIAAHLKLWPAMAIPAFLDKRHGLLAGGAVGVVLALPFAAPYVLSHVRESLDLYVRYFEFNAGLYYGVKQLYLEFTGRDWSKELGPALRLVFLMAVAGVWVLSRGRPRRAHAPLAALWGRLKGAWARGAREGRWPLETVLYAIVSLQLITATTIHPWYLYAVLLLAALRGKPSWAWQWVSVWSIGTYLLYVGGPYWPFVIAGWVGFALIGAAECRPAVVRFLLERRAQWKAEWLSTWIDRGPVLDVGGAEGLVARELASHGLPADVLEVEDSSLVSVPYTVYDGGRMPIADGSYEAATAVFVLHHTADPGMLLGEMLRVTRGPIVILESVHTGRFDHALLTILDRLANGLRAPGSSVLKASSHFRTPEAWRAVFGVAGLRVTAESIRYNLFHKKHLFRLERAMRPERG